MLRAQNKITPRMMKYFLDILSTKMKYVENGHQIKLSWVGTEPQHNN